MSNTNWRLSLASLLLALVASAAGCPRNSSPPSAPDDTAPAPARTLRILVVDDESLAASLEREWQARSETPIAIQQISDSAVVGQDAAGWSADVVVFPSGLLGELAESERIVPLTSQQLDVASFDRPDVFEAARRGETVWGKQTFAVSLGSPQLTLAYRRDLFDALELTPPTTWGEYQELVKRLTPRADLGDQGPPTDEPWSAAREPLGPGWAGQTLLARAAAYARHPNQYSTLFDLRDMRPLINGPPFVLALEELIAAATTADGGQPESPAASPAEVRDDLLAGRCAIALTWPSHADSDRSDVSDRTAQPNSSPVGFAPLPGAARVYNFRSQAWDDRNQDAQSTVPLLATAGRLAALTRAGKRSQDANTMLLWLGGVELGSLVAPTSSATTLFRGSQVSAVRRWVNPEIDDQGAREYGERVRETQSQSVWLSSLRIPGRARYLAALDEAVNQALAGEEPEDALAEAARQWETITDELDRDSQQRAYTRSIGLEP